MDTESSEDFVSLLQTTQFAIGQEDDFQVNTEKIDLGWRQQPSWYHIQVRDCLHGVGVSTEAEKCLHIDFYFVNGFYFKSYFILLLLFY